MARARAPVVLHSVYIVGPSLMAFGRDEQRAYFLPKIARGEAGFSRCYSEPGASSDLPAVETQAVADGDDFVITGQKVFPTAAHRVGYCWLLARTDPDVRRKLAQMRIEMDVVIRFVKRTVWMQANRQVPNVEASINKVWATEMLQRMSNLGTQIMGLHGTLMP